MFRNRKNTQKPDDVFIQKFQRTFSGIMPSISQPDASGRQEATELVDRTRSNMDGSDMKPNEQFPQTNPGLRLSSPFVNPNSLSFLPFANQSNNFLIPNYGRFSGGLHSSRAGDLHTPTMGLGMTDSLFPSQQLDAVPMESDARAMGLNKLDQQLFSQSFQSEQPFGQQQSFAPSAFVHRYSGYDAMDEFIENSSLHDLDLQADQSLEMPAPTPEFSVQDNARQGLADQKFQYITILHAPTAMVKSSTDIPISYLNKGQTYSLSVADSNPPPMDLKVAQYRTFVRVSFQEEEKRAKPAACWRLWKEGRGSSEAPQRGGKLHAVEYVDPLQGGNVDPKCRQVLVESTSFDGFCVTWTAGPNMGISDCTIAIRFNFLSTDFSHSKGVKGVPVRLCAKTQLISDVEGQGRKRDAEVCYCQVQLFRDHGAERKLSNDITQVKKTIERLRQRIIQAEMSGGNNGKRKLANASVAFKSPDHRPSKITKHKRAWSMGLQEGSERLSMGDDLHDKLAMAQEMFASTRPVSRLDLQEDEQDDPDLFPVQPPGDNSDSPHHTWNQVAANLYYDLEYQGSLNSFRSSSISHSKASQSQPVNVQRNPNVSTGYIVAVGMDLTYQPPAEQPPKPIACFYLRFTQGETQKDDFYRAVYLGERSVHDMLEKISLKRCIDPKRIVRVVHIKQGCLKIMVDDEFVRELPDGQDMDVEFSEEFDGTDDSMEPTVELRLSY